MATVADCVQNPPRNGVACGRGFTVEHMSKGEQMQEQKMPVVAVVLAAGFGTRFDENNPKQLVSVGGKPIVCWSIEHSKTTTASATSSWWSTNVSKRR